MKSVPKKLFKSLDIGKGFDRRIWLVNDAQQKLSYWNDIPIQSEGYESNIINSVIEIPRYTIAKLEMQKDEINHPIRYEVRQNRYNKEKTESHYWYQFGLFNYAYVPQTWESTLTPNKEIDNLLGDDDPIDLVEISDKQFEPGTVVPVRVFGIFALIDQGEIDWKIIGLNKEEADEKKIFTLKDLDENFPCRLESIKRWFKNIKIFEGKKKNWIYFDEKILDLDKTFEVISESNKHWKELRDAKEAYSKSNNEFKRKLLEISKKYHMNNPE